jgi:putative peptidoglycan lipid II flippase
MYWLCAGVLVGGGLQMGVPALVLMRAGWRPRFDLELSPRVRTIAQLMVPSLLGTAIYQVNIYVSRLLAFSVSDSSATLLFYANRLMELPIGVFAIAVATVVYPLIARHAVEQNFTAMAAAYHKGLRLILMINVPAAAGLALLSEPIVRWLFQHGKFTPLMTQTMAPLLMLFAVGMPFFSVASLTTRACYALKDMGAPVRMAAVSFAVNLGLSLLLMGPLAARGLVVASTLAVVVQTVLLQRALVKRLPAMRFGQLWLSLAKVGGATLAMGSVVAGLWFGPLQSGQVGSFADTLAIFVLIPIGAGVYGAMLWTLRIEGREDLAAIVVKLRSRFRFGGAS